MLASLTIVIVEDGSKDRPLQRATAALRRDLSFIPYPGMLIESPVWDKPREVVRVVVAIQDGNSLSIDLGRDEIHSDEEYAHRIERYRACGWEVCGDWVPRGRAQRRTP